MLMHNICRWLLVTMCGLLASCAIITVNVYFPEKDVKQAYKSLDDMLLRQETEKSQGEAEKVPPTRGKVEETKPQSLLRGTIPFSFVKEAFAEESVADILAVELASAPEVLQAYDQMKERLPLVDSLKESGAIGETRQGLVSVRDKEKVGDKQPLVEAENRNRKTIITAMAKAILKLDKKEESTANLNKVLGKAAATYATTKQEEAKPGWWIELQNGRWVQK